MPLIAYLMPGFIPFNTLLDIHVEPIIESPASCGGLIPHELPAPRILMLEVLEFLFYEILGFTFST